jgi:CheY-like chemotaxis protein
MMPNMNGFELIKNIRLTLPEQSILVLSSISDLNEMRDIVNLGVDGILLKPFDQDIVFKILIRILKNIHNRKIKTQQATQLQLFAKKNIALKCDIKQSTTATTNSKNESHLSKKYNIRKTVYGQSATNISLDIDFTNNEKIDKLKDELFEYESLIVSLEGKSLEDIILGLKETTNGLELLIQIMEGFDYFTVSVDAAKNLITFINSISVDMLSDESIKQLFIDAYLALFEDISLWIEKLFVNQDSENINYFDASFANTCLEIEIIFSKSSIEDDDSELEFF